VERFAVEAPIWPRSSSGPWPAIRGRRPSSSHFLRLVRLVAQRDYIRTVASRFLLGTLRCRCVVVILASRAWPPRARRRCDRPDPGVNESSVPMTVDTGLTPNIVLVTAPRPMPARIRT
jgi:hypothetical protein